MNPSSPAFSLVLMVLLIAMIYFMMIRPQKKKEKADKEMRDALQVGDEIISIGGIVGKVEKINEKSIIISTSAGKNKIEILKSAIASVTSKGPNAAAKTAAKEAAKEEEEKAPSRDKKVTPKKLSRKSDDAE
jgi:preprotein translocase subunit YajC